ncbi:hypothetical protein TZ00_02775 [Agreia bicolorata]|uniref:Uncharacterized protein n=1 Tax=Agreia bicolorata TaxID=110935 RepID=A0ABR5CJI2_9MICO|nr:hypothetical protein TZ00_02775 [Agreia bicolorata]
MIDLCTQKTVVTLPTFCPHFSENRRDYSLLPVDYICGKSPVFYKCPLTVNLETGFESLWGYWFTHTGGLVNAWTAHA